MSRTAVDFTKLLNHENLNLANMKVSPDSYWRDLIEATSNYNYAEDAANAFVYDINGDDPDSRTALERLRLYAGADVGSTIDTGSVQGKNMGGNAAYNDKDRIDEGNASIDGSAIPTPGTTTTLSYKNSKGGRSNFNVIWDTDKIYFLDSAGNVKTYTSVDDETVDTRLRNSINTITEGLNRWWLPIGLQHIEEAYGISFEDKTLRILFNNDSDSGVLALTGPDNVSDPKAYETFAPDNISMIINLDGKDLDDINYLGLTIAHELVHAVQFANGLIGSDKNGNEINLPAASIQVDDGPVIKNVKNGIYLTPNSTQYRASDEVIGQFTQNDKKLIYTADTEIDEGQKLLSPILIPGL